MLPERLPPDDPGEWLNRAYSNLIQAGMERTGAYLLTDHAVALRYPGVYGEVEREEYLEAVALAEAVVVWADESIR